MLNLTQTFFFFSKNTAQKLDNARLSASDLADTKTVMSALLADLSYIDLRDALKFEEADSQYCSVKDLARSGQQHIEALAVIFSGSQNEGVSYCEDKYNPFNVASEGIKGSKGKNVVLKKNWQMFFPTMVILQQSNVPPHVLTRGFCKKSMKAIIATPTSSSSSSSSSSFTSSTHLRPSSAVTNDFSDPPPKGSQLGQCDLHEDYFSNANDALEIDLTPEKLSSRQLFQTGDVTETYVIDRMVSHNKGYCSLIVTGSTPLVMEFNLDETCSEAKVFDSLPGTHRWMLYKDVIRGELSIPRGRYVSITSVLSDRRVTCCVETVGPSDVLWNDSPQLYKLHRDYFRMPELYFSSPISIE